MARFTVRLSLLILNYLFPCFNAFVDVDARRSRPIFPRREGTACEDLFLCNATAADLVLSDSNDRRTILPLLWGEGRGEGKGIVVYPADLPVSQGSPSQPLPTIHATFFPLLRVSTRTETTSKVRESSTAHVLLFPEPEEIG